MNAYKFSSYAQKNSVEFLEFQAGACVMFFAVVTCHAYRAQGKFYTLTTPATSRRRHTDVVIDVMQ